MSAAKRAEVERTARGLLRWVSDEPSLDECLGAWADACRLLPGCEDLISEAPDWRDELRRLARENGRRKLRAAFPELFE